MHHLGTRIRCLSVNMLGCTPVFGPRPFPSLWSHVPSRRYPSLWFHILSGGAPVLALGGGVTPVPAGGYHSPGHEVPQSQPGVLQDRDTPWPGQGYPQARAGLGYPLARTGLIPHLGLRYPPWLGQWYSPQPIQDWGTPFPGQDWGTPSPGLVTPRAVCLLRFPAGGLSCSRGRVHTCHLICVK